MIELEKVTKVYGQGDKRVVALAEVSLQIQKGEIFGIIGLSGAGKSTLIRCINKLEEPQAGKIYIAGQEITKLRGKELRAARRRIGMIFQHFNLLSSRTVYRNIAFPLEVAGVNPKEREERVNSLIELVGLTDKINSYPAELSGGQKQRVGIARALANNPEVLLCDEATSALDPETTKSILRLLQDVNRRFGLTIILITHQMEVIKEICDTVAVIDEGRIVEQGPVVELFARPRSMAARRFMKGVLHAEIPREIQERVFADPAPGQRGKMIRISFIGEVAGKPIISAMIRQFHVEVNILYANLDFIKNNPFGSIIIELTGEDSNIEKALAFLNAQGLKLEVLSGVEPNSECDD
ncbi:MAG TPA: methionine ABC transporter ATP-binding protein [Firmicutes bacterium]|nr:methionine ABC transporter ATP-binding protein [Bacillota bacterium]